MELYDGTGRVDYEDGAVYPNSIWITGVASVSAEDGADLTRTPNPITILPANAGYGRITFHSARYAYSSELDQDPFGEDADTDVIQPFISASHPLGLSLGRGALNFMARYGFAEADVNSPWARTAVQRLIEEKNVYYFDYDILMPISSPLPSPPFDTLGPAILWDVPLWAQAANAPETSSQTFLNTVETFTAMSRSKLDVQFHEVLLGLNWEYPIRNRMTFGLTAGLTVNVVDWTLTHSTEWTDSSGTSIQSQVMRASDEDVVLGATGEASLRYSIDSNDRYFVELHGGYAWVEDVNVKCDSADATIDLSMWTAGGNVGIVL